MEISEFRTAQQLILLGVYKYRPLSPVPVTPSTRPRSVLQSVHTPCLESNRNKKIK